MRGIYWKVFAFAVFVLCFLAHTAAAELVIDTDYQLVSKARSGRTTYDYTYQVSITNDGADAFNVSATVTSSSPYTTIVDGEVSFGDVAGGLTEVSSDTFMIRQNRRYPFDPSVLSWDTEYAAAAETIGPPGGVVEVTDPDSELHGVRLEVPVGAIEESETISISKGIPMRSWDAASPTVRLQPSGLVFNEGIRIIIPINDNAGNQDTFCLMRYNNEIGMYQFAGELIDAYDGQILITAELRHFSDYGLLDLTNLGSNSESILNLCPVAWNLKNAIEQNDINEVREIQEDIQNRYSQYDSVIRNFHKASEWCREDFSWWDGFNCDYSDYEDEIIGLIQGLAVEAVEDNAENIVTTIGSNADIAAFSFLKYISTAITYYKIAQHGSCVLCFVHTGWMNSDYLNAFFGAYACYALNTAAHHYISDYNEEGARIAMVDAGYRHTVGLKSDGTVIAVGLNAYGQCNVDNWRNIVQISAGFDNTLGLRSDGTVITAGSNDYGQNELGYWSNIKHIEAGLQHTVGLKSDSTVVAMRKYSPPGFSHGQCDVDSLVNIKQVAAGGYHTVGLKNDGTVIAVGLNAYGQCNVDNWRNIVQIAAGYDNTLGLKSDGTVIAVGRNVYGECNVEGWENIQQVEAGIHYSIGLKTDGTAIATGRCNYGDHDEHCIVENWSNIQQVAAGLWHTLGLKSDGTVVARGNCFRGQCNVEDWDLTP